MKNKISKAIFAMVVACILVGIIPIPTAFAASNGVQSALNEVLKDFPDGSYFTTTGKQGAPDDLISILKARGLSTSGFDQSYTCVGFAKYVWAKVFGHNVTAAYRTEISGGAAGDSTTWKNAKLGDLVYFYKYPDLKLHAGTDDKTDKYIHATIIWSMSSTSVTLYDCNYNNDNKIKLYTLSFGGNGWPRPYCKIMRANNYNEVNGSGTSNEVKLPLAINPTDYPSGKLNQGTAYSLKGTITSGYMITSITGEIVASNGTVIDSYTQTASTKNFSIYNSKIDLNLEFNKLSGGSYYIRYTAKDSSGASATWDSKSNMFTVGGGTLPSYTVSFDANGGSVSPTTKTFEIGTRLTGMPTPTRTGYIFRGWAMDKIDPDSNGVSVTTIVVDGEWTFDKDTTLYALWEKETYTVTFNANGGSVSQTFKIITTGSTYGALPTPTRSGYTFEGWYTSPSGGVQVTSNTLVESAFNSTLYAHWSETKQTYILFFDPDGGSLSINSKEVVLGDYYGELPTPYREGYEFEGWWTGRNGTGSRRWSGKYVTTQSDETVYAHWSLIDTRIKVHLDTNGGPDHGFIYYFSEGDSYGSLPSTEWVGYTFEGWYTKPTGGTKIYSTTRLIQNFEHTLYAHWTKEEESPEPSTLTISGLRVTVSDGKIRASATVTSNYDLMDFTYSNGAAGGGMGSVGKNRKTFEYTYEVDYTNLAYGGAGTYTFWLTCTDMSGNSVTATYDYYLPGR